MVQNSLEGIKRAGDGYLDAARKGDAVGASNFFTDDAVAYPPNSNPVFGRSRIEEAHKHEIGKGIDTAWRTIEVSGTGDERLVIGDYEIHDPHDRNALVDKGNFMILWKLSSKDAWKIHRFMYNSNLPRK
jgi:ketosteroid isomerase-like protein